MNKTDIQRLVADKELMHALGIVTMTWSLLNATIQATIWKFLNLDTTRGRILTSNLTSGQLIELLKTIFDFMTKSFSKEEKTTHNQFFTQLEKMNAYRNDIMHGAWEPIVQDKNIVGMKATRSMARGELKTREQEWNVESLIEFSRHINDTADTLVMILEELERQIAAAESVRSDKPTLLTGK